MVKLKTPDGYVQGYVHFHSAECYFICMKSTILPLKIERTLVGEEHHRKGRVHSQRGTTYKNAAAQAPSQGPS